MEPPSQQLGPAGSEWPVDGGAPIPVDIAEVWTLRHHQVVELRPYYWNPKPIYDSVNRGVSARSS